MKKMLNLLHKSLKFRIFGMRKRSAFSVQRSAFSVKICLKQPKNNIKKSISEAIGFRNGFFVFSPFGKQGVTLNFRKIIPQKAQKKSFLVFRLKDIKKG